MKNHLLHFVLVLLAFSFTSFSQAAPQAAADLKEWNFLVFINGVNNLDRYGAMNINQMEEVGSNDKMNILVQWGSLKNPNTTRLHVRYDMDKTRVTSPVVQNLGNVDMGDYKELVRFVEWAHQNYPAKRYFITIWNHGSGWNFSGANTGEIRPSDISYDDRTRNRITTEQLGVAMAEAAKIIGRKVDIYASDACLMGMVEVASQMQNSVSYFLGSQDNEPGEGWPYARFLSKWSAQIDKLGPKEIVQLHAKEFLNAYSSGGVYRPARVTMSAFDLSKISGYEAAFRNVSRYLQGLSNSDLTKAKQTLSTTKQFAYAHSFDGLDYLSQLETKGISHPSFSALRQAHQDFVVVNEQNQDNKTHGVSVWIGTGYAYAKDANRYTGLTFNEKTQWGSFLKLLNR